MPFEIGLAEKRKEQLKQELDKILPDIISLGVDKIILFGSLNSNTVHAKSDIDLIIVKNTERRFIDRSDEFYALIRTRLAVDIIVYTPVEFEEMKKNNQFIRFALKNGRVLYER
jgi:predicted nucleotidyltransferase